LTIDLKDHAIKLLLLNSFFVMQHIPFESKRCGDQQKEIVFHLFETFATKNFALWAKMRIAILNQSRSNPQLAINSDNEICIEKQATPSADESINGKRANPAQKVNTDFATCNFCLADVAVGTNKKKLISVCLQSVVLRNNSDNLPEISQSLLFSMKSICSVNTSPH